MTQDVDKLIVETEEALARVERDRARVLGDFDRERDRLRASLRALRGKRARPTRTAAVQAGPAALDAVRSALARGPRSQVGIVEATGLNQGTVSYAIKALIEGGEVEPTGKTIDRSRELRLHANGRRRAA